MRRPTKIIAKVSFCLALGFLTSAGFSTPSTANDPIYRIDLNKTQILRLPAAAGSVIIGNPSIADVTVHSPTTVMVVGRGFGETNLIILDRDGNTMVDADVQVTSITPSNGVRLFKANARETYTCAPYCQPSPVLGDSSAHIANNAPQAQTASAPTQIFDQGADALIGLSDFGGDAELQGSFGE